MASTVSECCGFCYNHVTLINNVYPTLPGEEGPRGSALSLVIFYATSKPHKLPKIGAYLEKRARSDARAGRYGNVRVALHILHSLLTECRQNCNLISKNILRIILEVLDSPDPDLVMQATGTFILFSAHHNHQNVLDSELNDIYTKLIQKFCNGATYETADEVLKHKTRLCGLKALEAVCGSDSFMLSPSLGPYTQIIIPAVLTNLSNEVSNINASSMDLASSPYNKRNSSTNQVISTDELKNLSRVCMKGLFSEANVTTIKDFLMILFKHLDEKSLWLRSNYSYEIFGIIVAFIQPQYQYAILALMIERLEAEKDVEKRIKYIRILSFVIYSGEGTTGVSIPELLETFVRHLKGSSGSKLDSNGQEDKLQSKLHRSLIDAIASLASHLAYPNQINDIVMYLVNRLSGELDSTASDGDILPTILLVQSLDRLLSIYKQGFQTKQGSRPSLVGSGINSEILIPTFRVLTLSNADLRLHFSSFLLKSIQMVHFNRSEKPEMAANNHFVVSLWQAIYGFALRPGNNPADFVIIGNVALASMLRFMYDDLFCSVPVLFHLQAQVLNSTISNISHQLIISSMIVEYFNRAAQFYNVAGLATYVGQIKERKTKQGEWFDSFDLSDEVLGQYNLKTFIDISNNTEETPKVLTITLDKLMVVDLLLKAERLSGLENSKAKLLSEAMPWETLHTTAVGSGGHVRQMSDSTARKSTTIKRNSILGAKYQMSPGYVPNNPDATQVSVRIEDLKEALQPDNKSILGNTTTESFELESSNDFNDSSENVTRLLKSIRSTFGAEKTIGSRAASPPQTDSVELDWLTARSRQLSPQATSHSNRKTGTSYTSSQVRAKTASNNQRNNATSPTSKMKQPNVLYFE